MNHELLENNKVYLSGQISSKPEFSHEVFGESFYQFNMSILRLSGQYDIIPITISERIMGNLPFEIGSQIAIKGQFRSYNKLVGDKSKLVLTVFVREIVDVEDDANPNVVELSGYICKEPIYRTTPFNREIADILLAVNRAYNKSDYIPCIAWGRNARFVSDIKVGTRITLIGRVQSREYTKVVEEGKEPEIRRAYEVSISKIALE
ncbi:MAG: single-stranded DNA-binding protein [Clostridia bacterium]|nr:single-stranded DNA-binding protein [Clostridia bacterium]